MTDLEIEMHSNAKCTCTYNVEHLGSISFVFLMEVLTKFLFHQV